MMPRALFANIVMNVILTVIFVVLHLWALGNGFEETFITLALLYGIAVTLLNALYIFAVKK